MPPSCASRIGCVGAFSAGWTLFIVVLYGLLTSPSSLLTATLQHHLLGTSTIQRHPLLGVDHHHHSSKHFIRTATLASRPLGLDLGPTSQSLRDDKAAARPFLAPLPVLLTTLVLPVLMWAAQRRLQSAHMQDAPLQHLLAVTAVPKNEVRDEAASTADDAAHTFRPVLEGSNVLFEQDEGGVVILSNRKDSELWMGFSNPDAPLDFGLEYFQSQAAIILCTGPHTRVLMLGLGLGALPATVRAVHPQTEIDVVEVDPDVIRGTRELLHLQPDSRFHILQEDAAEFVRRTDRRGYYDLILLDCFDEAGIPPVFQRLEFFQDAIQCLKPNGVLSVNVIEPLPEVGVIRKHLHQLLPRPRQLMCTTNTNCALFGSRSVEGDAVFERSAMLHRALAMDQAGILPYSLSAQVDRIVTL